MRELLKREIGEAIRRDIPIQQAGVVNVNDILISADFKSARVRLGFFGTPEQQKRAFKLLEDHRGRIQEHVAKTVILKYTPVLRFEVDDSIERGNRILRIMEDIDKTLPPEKHETPGS